MTQKNKNVHRYVDAEKFYVNHNNKAVPLYRVHFFFNNIKSINRYISNYFQ
jgi:hypothetical protein